MPMLTDGSSFTEAKRGPLLVKSANRVLGIRGAADRPDAVRSRQRMKDSFI
jgi:hypothetical protein